jgi:hypothetical protein
VAPILSSLVEAAAMVAIRTGARSDDSDDLHPYQEKQS